MFLKHFLMFFLGISSTFIANTVARVAIVGGNKAKAHEFPYQVIIMVHPGPRVCGGGIIEDDYVITAAHCFLNEHDKFDVQHVTVIAGTNDLGKVTDSAVYVDVLTVHVPVVFKPPTNKSSGDLAVLKLKTPMELSKRSHLTKLKLPEKKEDIPTGKAAKIAGFGLHWMKIEGGKEEGGHTDGVLRFAETNLLSAQDCQAGYADLQITNKYLCARVKPKNVHQKYGVCTGDSGGPLVHEGTAIGILSTGPFGCVEDVKAGLYTRISYYLDFIHNAMKNPSDPGIRTLQLR